MEVTMSSPIQACAEMEKDRADADLLHQEIERKKLIRKLKHNRPHVGMIPQSLILDSTALVQLSKAQSKKNRKLLKEHIENPEIKLEVARQIVDMITHPSIPDYSMITESSILEFSNSEFCTTANVQSHEHKSTKKLLGEHIENPESKLEVARQNVDVMTQSSIEDNANTDLGTAATVELSKPQKRRKRKLPREDTENPESKPEVPCRNVDDIIQSESSVPKREGYMEIDEEHTEVANVEMGSNMPKNVHAEGTIEKKVSKRSKRKKQTLGEDLNPCQLEDMEVATGEMDSGTTETDNTVSKKRKRQMLENKNPASGDILGTSVCINDTVLAKNGLSSTKILELTSGQPVSCKTATPDANMSEGKEQTEVANGEIGSSELKKLKVNDIVPKRDEQKSKKQRLTLGEIPNPQYLQNLEAGNIATIGKRTEKRKRQKARKKGDAGLNVIPRIPTSEKKLLVIDVNGLLADIVRPSPKDVRADKYFSRGALFKRPFLDDFLHFCFEKFHVAIWSSRTKKVLEPMVNYLLGGFRYKLLFIWHASQCSKSGTMTRENEDKRIVFKDLRKIWENNGPCKSWLKGTYNDSNTLLLDDSPYKALLNPKHNGIFPVSYSYTNKDDNFLGPTGALRTYLEGVAATDDLKMYVEQHPFGQSFIDEKDPDWSFYEGVLKGYQTSITK